MSVGGWSNKEAGALRSAFTEWDYDMIFRSLVVSQISLFLVIPGDRRFVIVVMDLLSQTDNCLWLLFNATLTSL